MTQLPVGGPAATTYRVTSRAHVTGRVAVPAYLVTDGRAVEGGPSQQVYYVSDAEIALGEFVVAGDIHPIPIVAVNNVNTEYPPIPIYVVNPPSAPITRLSLPLTNQQGFWYGGDGSKVDETITATADAQPVTAWADRSANAYDLAKAGAGTITYRQSVTQFNNRGAVDFDGNSYLWRAVSASVLGNENVYSIYIVLRTASTATTQYVYAEGSDSNNNPIVSSRINMTAAGRIGYWHRQDSGAGAPAETAASVSVNDGNAHILTVRRIDNGHFSMRLDGVEVLASTTGPGTTTTTRLAIGALLRAAAAAYTIAQVACVAVYNADNYATVEPLLATHYGITIPHELFFYGVWSWFSNPRAVELSGGEIVTGAVNKTGDVIAIETSGGRTTLGSPVTLSAALEIDDHDHPSYLIRSSDLKLITMYGMHNGADIFKRVSSNAEDASAWGTQVSIDADLGMFLYSYSNPIQLTGEANAPIYLFYRANPGGGYTACYSKSTDGGATWQAGAQLLSGVRPYTLVCRNGTGRIDILCTDGHPAESATNSVYHFYYQANAWHASDGTVLGALPYLPATDLTRIYDGSTNNAWIQDIAIGVDGNPRVLFDVFVSDTDHRYYFGRWTGAAWVTVQICTGGTYIYDVHYSGGMAFDHANPNVVYAARETGDGIHQIYKYTTADNGATWSAGTKMTSSQFWPCFRPVVCSDKVLYLHGRYTTYADYDTSVIIADK